jgi:hypothetical protein
MPARQPAVVAMIDGLDPAYVTDETMPVFERMAAEGTSRVVQAVMPEHNKDLLTPLLGAWLDSG